jgi:hypothetical protein
MVSISGAGYRCPDLAAQVPQSGATGEPVRTSPRQIGNPVKFDATGFRIVNYSFTPAGNAGPEQKAEN